MSQDQSFVTDPELLRAWKNVVDTIKKVKDKQAQMLEVMQTIDLLIAQCNVYLKNKKQLDSEEVAQLFVELSKHSRVEFSTSEDAKPFHRLLLAITDFSSPNGKSLPKEVLPYWKSEFSDHYRILALTSADIIFNAIKLSEEGLDHAQIQFSLRDDTDYGAVMAYFFNRLPLYKHKAELEPFFNAAKVAMANFEKKPLTALRKLFMLYQEVKKNITITGGDDVAGFYGMLFKLFGKFPDKHRILFDQAVWSLHNDFGAYLSTKDSQEMGKFISFLRVVNVEGFQSRPADDVQSSPRSKKIAEVFCKRERLANHIINEDKSDPFYLKGGMSLSKTMQKWVDKVTDQYDRTHGLPIEKLVDYIIKHPDSAEHFLKRRSVGNRNFRREFCRNPELVHKLLNSKDPQILEAMQKTKFLDSTHLPDRLRKSFKEKHKLYSPAPEISKSSRSAPKLYSDSALNEILDLLNRGITTVREYVHPTKPESNVALLIVNEVPDHDPENQVSAHNALDDSRTSPKIPGR